MMHREEKINILLVDDDVAHRTMLAANLEGTDFHISEVEDGDQVLPFLEQNSVDLILLDMKMSRMGGLATLLALKETVYTNIPVLILTAFSSVETAVKAMRNGAYDYVAKPIDLEELQMFISKALGHQRLKEENIRLRQHLEKKFSFHNMVGTGSAMEDFFNTLALVAPTDATILITGESGTGKELVACALHQQSGRRQHPFIKVNCAALNENLLESELFGHEAGAFTGAISRRKGRFEQADMGTLFLDEIGDMSLQTQAKILRVLQEGEIDRLGGTETIKVDVRLLTATHRNLQEMIEENIFRQDLFFRLSVVPLQLPPLRKRTGDIPELAGLFLKRYTAKNRKDIKGFLPMVLRQFLTYPWPGNIRELENTVERAVILCPGEYITIRELPPQLQPPGGAGKHTATVPPVTLRDMEREMIGTTLARNRGNKSKTAKILGVARQTLANKIKEYKITST